MIESNIKPLLWDSQFFGKRVGNVNDVGALNAAEMSGYELICKKINASDYQSLDKLTDLGFVVAEGELDFTKNIELNTALISDYSAFIANENDIAGLVALAKRSYKYSRFREPWFSESDKSRLYGTWVEKAVLGQFDDVCLIIKSDHEIKGFITLKKKQLTLRVGLIAVSEKFRGQGLARELLGLAELYAKSHSCSEIKVATQISNVVASILYAKQNYFISDTSYWMYRVNCI